MKFQRILIKGSNHDLKNLGLLLRLYGLTNYSHAASESQLLQFLQKHQVSLILLTPTQSLRQTCSLIEKIQKIQPFTQIIMHLSLKEKVDMQHYLKLGVTQFIIKPLEPTQVYRSVKEALDLYISEKESPLAGRISKPVQLQPPFNDFITSNLFLNEELKFAQRIALKDQPILITGEVGVGKKKLAKIIARIHNQQGPDATPLLSYLDYKNPKNRPLAKGATVLVENPEGLSLKTQEKLLEEIKATLGSRLFLFITEENLQGLSLQGIFSTGLYAALKPQEIEIPPLRERPKDIRALGLHFLKQLCKEQNIPKAKLPRNFDIYAGSYSFPENVRELKKVIHLIFQASKGSSFPITPLKGYLKKKNQSLTPLIKEISLPSFNLKTAKKEIILEALKRTKYNHTAAAHLLGFSRQALSQQLKSYEEDASEDE